MASVTVYSKEHVDTVLGNAVASAAITSGHLVLTLGNGSTVDVGPVVSGIPDSSDTVKGVIEVATDTETISGTDSTRAVTPFGLSAALALGRISYNVKVFGAKGDGTTNDTTVLQSILNSAIPGSVVELPPGVYVTTGPLTIPPQVTVRGTHGGHIDDQVNSMIKPAASFSGSAVIKLVDQATGGYSVPSTEQRIEKLSIDGRNLPGTTIDGILATGYVHGVYIDDVQVRFIPNHGLNTVNNASGTPYSWHVRRLHVSSPKGIGISASMTDATWIDCEVLGGDSHGWFAGGGANSCFVACRAEWNSFNGFDLGSGTGSANGSGGPVFIACSTDRNGQNGVAIPSAANGQAPVTFIGCNFRRDGRNSTSGGWAAVNVNGSTQPIILSGCQSYTGTSDDGSGNSSPQYGLSVTGATSVQVNGGIWHGINEGIRNGGSNVRLAISPNTVERTGPTSAPVTVTRAVQTYGDNGGSLDVPEHLAGIPHPRAYGLAGWTYPPENASSGKLAVAGTLYLARVYVPRPLTATKIGWGSNTAGATPTTGQNWLGIYNSIGTLLGSVNIDGRVASQGAWIETITGIALVPGAYWVAFLFNAATPPSPYRAGDLNGGLMNLGLTNSNLRWATNGTGLTALPSSITPSSNASVQASYFAAIG